MKNKSKKLIKLLYLLVLPILYFTILQLSSCAVPPTRYTVSFDTDNGSLVSAQILLENEKVAEPKNPTKDGYIFSGWYTNTTYTTIYDFDTIVEHSFTLYSYWVYDDTFERGYTVSFEVDGIIYQTSSDVLYGTTPVYSGVVPTKPSTSQYDYTFASWVPSIKPVSSDITYKAGFISTLRSYTVTFLDADSSVLQTDYLCYGSIPSYNLPVPTKPSTLIYDFTFISWNQSFVAVTQDITYTPIFNASLRNYYISFLNYNNQVLQYSLFPYGEIPVYTSITPTMPSTDEYSYTFAGWDDELTNVSGEASYTAEFTSSKRKYNIDFVNDDLSLLQSSLVEYGTLPAYTNSTPIKDSSAQFDYTFDDWDNIITLVFKDTTYKATYITELRYYTVTFLNYDSEVLQSSILPYGGLPSYDLSTPYKESTPQYDYTFVSWDTPIKNVDSDITYTAVFDSILRQYTVIFENYDHTILQSSSVSYGTLPVYENASPTKTEDIEHYYDFVGWNTLVVLVTEDATYTATFENVLRRYFITFFNTNGEVLQDSLVEYNTLPTYDGETPTLESDPQYDYVFVCFTPEILAVTESTSYTASYEPVLRSYTITFVDVDLEIVQSTTFEYGTLPTYNGLTLLYPSTPEFDYVFEKWNPTITNVSGEQTYEASLLPIRRSYSIVFKNYDLTQLQNTEVEYGTLPVYQGETPTKPS
ncbi:MAG: InlB B-repeat-containing protein, partial [Acholeplasmatales bacterium]|nr:InlB B-repeat-containing protein [Acholeplasmatales bacterium]